MSAIPDVIRAAIEAQGKVDPQEIEAALERGLIPEPPPEQPRQPDDERPEAEQLALGQDLPTAVGLTTAEASDAYEKGLARYAAARARGGRNRYGYDEVAEEVRRQNDGESAVAEALVARALGRRWTSDGIVPDAPEAGDIEGGIGVRWTARGDGCLIVHEHEPEWMRMVLVVGRAPHQRIAGWTTVAAAKQDGDWRANVRHPAFFCRQQELRPLSEFPRD